MRKSAVVAASVFALFLSACASSNYARVKAEKTDPQFKATAGRNTLVLFATQDPAGREGVETQFAIEGVERKIDLTPSHRLIPSFKDVSKESLISLIKSNGFDRVLIIRIVPGSAKTGKHTDYIDHYSVVGEMSGLYPGMYDYWGATSVVVYSPTDPPPTMGMFVDMNVETVLYDSTRESAPIWSSITEVTSSRMHGDAGKDYVRTMIAHLQRAGLL